MIRNVISRWSRFAALALLVLPAGSFNAAAAANTPVIPKWSRFEQEFKSSVLYSNALQDASVTVLFTSPLGELREVDGFWDGGRTWRVRFSPDQPGRWSFKTTCSDAANPGLHGQKGSFLCSAAIGLTRFQRHGQVRVAHDRRYLEHADGTPFFWLADTAWAGARAAELKDWQFYAQTRTRQRFTVAQWAVAPGSDARKQVAWTGFPERIGINPDFFQRLDAKLEVLSQAGILSAIVPLLETQAPTDPSMVLPDDQAELLVRYVVARWGSEPVAWLLAFEGDATGKNVARWKKIGQAVFGDSVHAPVVLFPGQTQWALDEFRDQNWVDVFGYPSITDVTDDAFKWAVTGPFASEWQKEPARPLIAFAPCENGTTPQAGKRFAADDVRRAVYWSLLLAPPAGISYAAQGVADWDTTVEPTQDKIKGTDLPFWGKAMFMPAAKQMSHLAKYMNSIDFWRLRPQAGAIATQPGSESPRRFIAAASADPNTLSLVYVPEDRTLEMVLSALPAAPVVSWFNPRSGENNAAVAVVGGSSCQFPTPDAGDWLLRLNAGK
ncbi:MAG TPA: DUF4038 domain-containing protein [Verrucomicrobiota bacterium]|nr:DUF4038 domain-containing protein [Verrucomicrobiota bacterium]